jgi:cytochrome c-type protein NapC
MDLTKQAPRAAQFHERFLLTGEKTCIDCHKGIAHLLPDMTGIEPGWKDAPELQGKGSASWHGPERAVRTYLAEIETR